MQYIVQVGDTLGIIAQKFGTTVYTLVRENNIVNPDIIYVGQVLIISAGTMPTPIPPPIFPTPVPGVCPLLQRGSRGTAVIQLQRLLTNAGANPGAIDGIFGAKTVAAVRLIQTRKGIAVTGVVDMRTWEALGVNCGVIPTPIPPIYPTPPQEYYCPILKRGNTGSTVRFLQGLLKGKGYYKGAIDGNYALRTERAVKRLQRQQGLSVTGKVTGATWRALGVNCATEPKPPNGTPIDTNVSQGLRHILYTDKKVYNKGETIKISLVKTNVTDDEISLRYKTSQIVEIKVSGNSGSVWNYSRGRNFAQYTRLITIYPSGTQVIENTWNQSNNNGNQVSSGTYTIKVTNIATNVSLSVQVRIR
ncbi:MAG: peptidoglycan-binding protein [Clostridia bacterium]|nr:peptidoglycan-binding protein [Clostridia bacterium]MDD4048403.1 peptidoglycan-binding protein [Clostridia bacterium]